jgi:hypothetical protein
MRGLNQSRGTSYTPFLQTLHREVFFAHEKPEYVFLAAAKVGGGTRGQRKRVFYTFI